MNQECCENWQERGNFHMKIVRKFSAAENPRWCSQSRQHNVTAWYKIKSTDGTWSARCVTTASIWIVECLESEEPYIEH